MTIRESHFRRDQFGVVKVWNNGLTEVCKTADGRVLRCNSMREAKREANRFTLLESFQQFATGAFEFRATVVACDERVARKPALSEGTGFHGFRMNARFEASLQSRQSANY